MRGTGDFKYLLTLYAKGPTGRATEKLGPVYGAKRSASGKEFLQMGAVHQQRTAIFTLRRLAWTLDTGIEVQDAQGCRWQVVEITPSVLNPLWIDLRCVSNRLEGIGYA